MYHCPHCGCALKRWSVWFAGPFAARQCPACNRPYFGGGLPGAMATLCVGAYIGVLLYLLTGRGLLLLLAPLVGCLAGGWHMVRAQPVVAQLKWRESAKVLASPLLLWVAFRLSAKFALALGGYAS